MQICFKMEKRAIKRFLRMLFNVVLVFLSLSILLYGFLRNDSDKGPDKLPEGWTNIYPPADINSIAIFRDTVWVGGKEGVWAINSNTDSIIKKLGIDPPLEFVRHLVVDSAGVLWICHKRGLTRYYRKSFYTQTSIDGLPEDRVNTMIIDNYGKIWVGTWNGAAVYNENRWEVITKEDGLADNMVNVMLQDSENSIWFGSYTAPRGGLSILHEGEWQTFDINNGLPHNNITSLAEDYDGGIWVGTGFYRRGGAVKIKKVIGQYSIVSKITKEEGLAGEKVRSIFKDNKGILWVGSEYDGLAKLIMNRIEIIDKRNGLIHNEVKCITQDFQGNIWIGTRKGITLIDKTTL